MIPRPYRVYWAFTREPAGWWSASSREEAIGRAAYDLGVMCGHLM